MQHRKTSCIPQIILGAAVILVIASPALATDLLASSDQKPLAAVKARPKASMPAASTVGYPVAEHQERVSTPPLESAPAAASAPSMSADLTRAASQAIAASPSAPAASPAAPAESAGSAPSQSSDSNGVARYFGLALLIAAVVVPGGLLLVGWLRDRPSGSTAEKPKISIVIWWLLAFAMASASVAYACARSTEVSFWDGMIGSWLATLLGIVCGVPVAFELDRQRRRSEDTLKADAAKRLRLNVLNLLLDELQVVAQQLQQRTSEPTAVPVVPLKMSMWTATRDSGNLTAVSEPDLLQALSEAYRWIAVVAAAEVQHFQIAFGGDSRFPDGSLASETQLAMLQKYLPLTIEFVDAAIDFVKPLVVQSAAP